MRGPLLPAPRYATLNDSLAAAAGTTSGITLMDLREEESFLPFAEVRSRARRVAAALRGTGVVAGDRVALVYPTSPDFIHAFFGVLLAGAVPVPLYPPVRFGRLPEYHAATAAMLSAVAARIVLAGTATRRLLGRAVALAQPPLGCRTLASLEGNGPGELEEAADPDALALIQFSSGTTTAPKPIALTHRNLMAQLAVLKQLLPAEGRHPHLGVSWLPLYHDMGLISCLLLAVDYPGPLVLIPPEHFLARPALWLRAVSRHRATLSVAPAFGYGICTKRVRDAELAGVDLSSWRLAVCGAEPIAAEPLRRFAQRFTGFGFDERALCPVYGLAEASLAVTFSPPDRGVKTLGVDPVVLAASGRAVEGPRAIVSVGTPIPGCEVEVRAAGGDPAGDGRVGRIHVRGPSVMAGYFDQPGLTAAVLTDGWLDTGDLGFVADGELYVCGREKDVVIIRGSNHPAHEFEECLDGVEGLRTGCAVAVGFVPDGENGERLLILAERARGPTSGDDEAATVERVRRAIADRTGIRPHAVLLLEAGTLPRTSSGKLRRAEALRRFLAGELTPPARPGGARLSLELARSAIAFARLRRSRAR